MSVNETNEKSLSETSPLFFDMSKVPSFLESLSPADFILSTNDTSCEVHFIVIYTISPKVRALFEEDMTVRSLQIPIDDPDNYLRVFADIMYGRGTHVPKAALHFIDSVVFFLECDGLMAQHRLKLKPSFEREIVDIFRYLYDNVGNRPIRVVVSENEAVAEDLLIPSRLFPKRIWTGNTSNELEIHFSCVQVAITSYEIELIEPGPRMLAIEGFCGTWVAIDEIVFRLIDKRGKELKRNVKPTFYFTKLRISRVASFSESDPFCLGRIKFFGYVQVGTDLTMTFEQYAYLSEND